MTGGDGGRGDGVGIGAVGTGIAMWGCGGNGDEFYYRVIL